MIAIARLIKAALVVGASGAIGYALFETFGIVSMIVSLPVSYFLGKGTYEWVWE